MRPAPDEMIRAERRALLRADASALRNADREVLRTRWRADRMSDFGGKADNQTDFDVTAWK
jgi:hypothetical protein